MDKSCGNKNNRTCAKVTGEAVSPGEEGTSDPCGFHSTSLGPINHHPWRGTRQRAVDNKPLHNSDKTVPTDLSAAPLVTMWIRYICGHVSCVLPKGLWTEKTERVEGNKNINPILASLHLNSYYTASCSVVGASRLTKKHHHDPRTLALIWAEEKTQLLHLLLLLWLPPKAASRSMVQPALPRGQFIANLCTESISCSCTSLPKPPQIDSRFHLEPRSAHSDSAAAPPQHFTARLAGAKACPRSLGQSARCLFGAWHHNIFTADCCSNGHSTKGASCTPPPCRASIGKKQRVSHATTRFHWTAGRSIRGKGCATPGAFDEWAGLCAQLGSPHAHTRG